MLHDYFPHWSLFPLLPLLQLPEQQGASDPPVASHVALKARHCVFVVVVWVVMELVVVGLVVVDEVVVVVCCCAAVVAAGVVVELVVVELVVPCCVPEEAKVTASIT